jgi:diguanylate cyclase (GGDEF)-like protein
MATGRILVVDDERFFRELYGEILSGAGHAVRTAGSGEEALRALAAEPADLVVSDLVMPGMDGLAFIREARRLDPELEAVAVTGRDDVRLAVSAMKSGCADFLLKPVEAEELSAVASRVLSRARLKREHGQLLAENLEFVKRQSLYRRSLEILATLDLERLQDLALQVLASVADAQGAALWIADEKGKLTLRGYRGLVDRAALPPSLNPRDETWAEAFEEARPLQAPGAPAGEAFYVPLVADGEPLGLALLSDRALGRFGGDEQAAAQAVADFTAIAVKNARRFQALERFSLRDRETGAYNLAYFVDYAGKEFYKARRYGRAFSLVVLSVDNVEQLRRAGGRELYRRAMHDLVTAVGRVVRDADILAKVAEGEYYVLLPETDSFGALMFLRRAAEEIRSEASVRQLEERAPLLLSMGASAFPKDGEDFDELLHWARARVKAQRGSLVRRLHLGDLEKGAFWELCDLLLDERTRIPESSPSAHLPADDERFRAVQREAAREIARDPRARGLAYLGTSAGLAQAPVLQDLPPGDAAGRAGDSTVRVVLLGPRGDGEPLAHPLVTEVFLDGDKRLSQHEFLLFLSEHSAYAHLTGPEGRAFHTADEPLVDLLVAKLQAAYDLQPV